MDSKKDTGSKSRETGKKKIKKTPESTPSKIRKSKVGPLVLLLVTDDGMVPVESCPTFTVVKEIKDWMVEKDRDFEDQDFCIAQLKWMGKIKKTVKFDTSDK